MPKQGQSVESCIVSEFKKKVGDSVKVGDILFGYETDKATFEEESQVEGTVLAIFYKDGDEIPVLQNVMVIGQPGESFAEFAPAGVQERSDSSSAVSHPLDPTTDVVPPLCRGWQWPCEGTPAAARMSSKSLEPIAWEKP